MNFQTLSSDLRINHAQIRLFFEGKYDSSTFLNNAAKLAGDLSSYDNSRMAGRMLIYDVCRTCDKLTNYLKVMKHRLSKVVYDFFTEHIEIIQKILDQYNFYDYKDHDYFSASCVLKGYILKPAYDHKAYETPGIQKMRIAIQFYHSKGIERVIKCFYEMINNYYTPASPTIYNAGTNKPQQSSCFLLNIGDDFESILYTGVGDSGMISSLNGGLGITLSNIRHSQVGLTGMSSGIIRKSVV